MGRRKPKSSGRKPPEGRLGKKAVLELLGEARRQEPHAIRFLPVSLWPEHALFVGARDAHLKSLTAGEFPRGAGEASKSHPLFVLETLGNLAHKVCPCSSQRFFNRRFIEKGCSLEHTSYVVAERTYLVEDCLFQIPKDSGFLWSLRYWGRVPDCCLGREDADD